MHKEVPKYEPSKAYHATEEELVGDAYAVFDYESQVMYFRRIKDLDTSNFTSQFDDTRPFDKDRAVDEANHLVYYRGLEDNRNSFKDVFSQSYNSKTAKKIVFEDAFKPTFSDGSGLFTAFSNRIEEVDFSHFDSSNITNMTRMFEMVQMKKLDLSSFETSQVTDMSEMFKNAKIEEIDITSFSAANLERTYYMFGYNRDLITLKVSSKFSTDKVTNMQGMFYQTPKLELLDLSWLKANENTNAEMLFHTCGLKYIDLSHWKFKNGSGNRSSVFATSFQANYNLIYLDISNLTSDACGAYASGDFGLEDSVKVIKMSNEYNPKLTIVKSYRKTFYNENINDFTYDISDSSDSCEYRAGGVYLNILDESGDFTNYYKEVVNPDKKNNIIINPKTVSTAMILIILLLTMILVPILNKRMKSNN